MSSSFLAVNERRTLQSIVERHVIFSQLLDDFHTSFIGTRRFRACLSLIVQLDSQLNNQPASSQLSDKLLSSRFASIFILSAVSLNHTQTNNQSTNPFLAFFLSALDAHERALNQLNHQSTPRNQPNKADYQWRLIERNFLLRLLFDSNQSIKQLTPTAVVDALRQEPSANQSISESVSSEFARLVQPLRAIVQLNQPPSLPSSQSSPRQPHSASSAASHSYNDHSVSRSPSPSGKSNHSSQIVSLEALTDLLQKAQKSSLHAAERIAAVNALTSNDAICLTVINQSINPRQWSAIVEKNPSIASPIIECLLKLDQQNRSNRSAPYLTTLNRLELSLHSMEVVNRLTSQAATQRPPFTLPPDFLPSYIVHALDRCKSLKDKYLQTRLVRLVCVFLQSLLRQERHASIDPEAGLQIDTLFEEIGAFCAEFSKVKEAAQLFSAIKEKEAEIQQFHSQSHESSQLLAT